MLFSTSLFPYSISKCILVWNWVWFIENGSVLLLKRDFWEVLLIFLWKVMVFYCCRNFQVHETVREYSRINWTRLRRGMNRIWICLALNQNQRFFIFSNRNHKVIFYIYIQVWLNKRTSFSAYEMLKYV